MAERTSRRQHVAWAWFLGIAALVIVVTRVVPREAADALYALFGPAAGIAILTGVRWFDPPWRLPWQLIAASQLLWGVADLMAIVYSMVAGDTFPTPADPIYLIGYGVAIAGVTLLVGRRVPERDQGGNLDAAILAVALGLLSWLFLASPTIAASADSVPAALVGVSYPAANIVLAALLIRLMTTPGARTRAFRLLSYGLVLLIVADTISSALDQLSWEASTSYEALWLASYACLGAGGLHPGMAELTRRPREEKVPLTLPRLGALTAAALVAPVTLAVQTLIGWTVDTWAIIVGSVLTVLLVMARIGVAVLELDRLHAERERARAELAYQAAHDPLTGLPNRARALELLEAALAAARVAGTHLAVLFVDLDGFKAVNDTHGHRAGDDVLITCAERMRSAVRTDDTVTRLGGDEFVVLLREVEADETAVAVGQRLVARLAEPMSLPGAGTVQIGASVGVALAGLPAHGRCHPAARGRPRRLPSQSDRSRAGCCVRCRQRAQRRHDMRKSVTKQTDDPQVSRRIG